MMLERKAETLVSFEKAVSKLLGKPEATNGPTLQHTSTNTCAKNCSAIRSSRSFSYLAQSVSNSNVQSGIDSSYSKETAD